MKTHIRFHDIIRSSADILRSFNFSVSDRDQSCNQMVIPFPIYLNKRLITLHITIKDSCAITRTQCQSKGSKYPPHQNSLHNILFF